MPNQESKILITGNGVGGTTWLWWLFHELGYTTSPKGIDAHTYELLRNKNLVKRITKGELEWPQVIKHLGGFLKNMNLHVDTHDWEVRHVFMILRKLDSAIASRRRRPSKIKPASMGVSREEFGKMTWDQREEKMKERLIDGVGSGVFQAIERDYPFTVLRFPRAAIDAEYCYEKLKPVLEVNEIWFPAFTDAWERARRQGEGIAPRHFNEEGVEPPESLVKWWKEKDENSSNSGSR